MGDHTASFNYRFVCFRPAECAPSLPFVAGGASQNGPDEEYDNLNNQDAARLLIQEDYVIGVLCDGCASTHPSLEQFSYSSNEVGAKLLSYLAVEKLECLVLAGELENEEAFVRRLTEELLTYLGAMTMLSSRASDGQSEQFVFNFLMATLVGFVVTRDKYVVFHSGDGIVGVNGGFEPLDEQAGVYLANELLRRNYPRKHSNQAKDGSIRLLKSGNTADLEAIFVGTDGLMHLVEAYKDEWREFLLRRPLQTRDGFDPLLPEFRKCIAWKDRQTSLVKDDATFILLRRSGPPAEVEEVENPQ